MMNSRHITHNVDCASHAQYFNLHPSSCRSSVPATILRFCRRTRKSNRSMTHGTTMKGAFEVAGGSQLTVAQDRRRATTRVHVGDHGRSRAMFVLSFSSLLEVSEQQHVQRTERILGLASARRSATVINCAQYACNRIPRLLVHHGDLVLVMLFWLGH